MGGKELGPPHRSSRTPASPLAHVCSAPLTGTGGGHRGQEGRRDHEVVDNLEAAVGCNVSWLRGVDEGAGGPVRRLKLAPGPRPMAPSRRVLAKAGQTRQITWTDLLGKICLDDEMRRRRREARTMG